MKPSYKDIIERINEEPKWFDKNGVPRYSDLEPQMSSNIYVDEVVFLQIQCQNCQKKFTVELNWRKWRPDDKSFEERLLNWRVLEFFPLNYGDPPIHGDDIDDNCVGNTMSSDTIKIVQFWDRKKGLEFIRRKDLEIEIELGLD